MTSLIWPAAQNHTEAAAAAAASYRGWLTWQRRRRRPCTLHTTIQLVFFRFFFLVAFSCGVWRLRASSSPLSRQAGRHQRRRIMCNYNRQSKTKPFTFNEFLLEKGRLPQGGILMKQMAECSQGQTLTVLLFFFLQSTNNSSVLRSFTCLLTALCVHLGSECVCVIGFCLLTPLTRWKGGGIMSNNTESPFSCVPAAHKK